MMTDFCKKWIERDAWLVHEANLTRSERWLKKRKQGKILNRNLFLERFAVFWGFERTNERATGKSLKLPYKRRLWVKINFPSKRIVQFEFVLNRSFVVCALPRDIRALSSCSTLTERFFMIYDFADKKKTSHGKSKITHDESEIVN